MPVKDDKADMAKRKERFEWLATQGKEKLERQHANFLNPDYKPNKDWWGSAPKD